MSTVSEECVRDSGLIHQILLSTLVSGSVLDAQDTPSEQES